MKQSEQQAFSKFRRSVQTLALSTLNVDQKPHTSYAPFAEDEEGNFYIFVSQLAQHTNNLRNNRQASIMLLEDEQDANQVYALQRITYQCDVMPVDRQDVRYPVILNALQMRFGGIIKQLKMLDDFTLFQLTPTEGSYIMGFGQAYRLTGEKLNELEPVEV